MFIIVLLSFFQTADENWNPAYLKESSKEMATNYINKLASLISCAIYCNSDEKLLNGHQKDEIIVTNMFYDFLIIF